MSPPGGAKAGMPAAIAPKPAEAEGSEGPDTYPPPARVSVGSSPVYIPERKLGKGGFGQVGKRNQSSTSTTFLPPAMTLHGRAGGSRIPPISSHEPCHPHVCLTPQVWLGRKLAAAGRRGAAVVPAVLEGAAATEVALKVRTPHHMLLAS